MRRRRGSNALELALIAPVLVAFMAGAIDYGWYFYTGQIVASATHDAARAGSMTALEDSPSHSAREALEGELRGAGLEHFEVRTSLAGDAPERVLIVEAEVTHAALFGLLPLPDEQSSRATMLLEDQSAEDGDAD